MSGGLAGSVLVPGLAQAVAVFAAMSDDVFLPLLPPEQYPHLSEVASALLAAGYDPAIEFTFGLDVILEALERLRRTPEA